jgi:hypothetical protein
MASTETWVKPELTLDVSQVEEVSTPTLTTLTPTTLTDLSGGLSTLTNLSNLSSLSNLSPAVTDYRLTPMRPSLVSVHSAMVPLDVGTLTNFKDFISGEVRKVIPREEYCMTLSEDENYAVGEEFINWAERPFWLTSEMGRNHAIEEYADDRWGDVCDVGQNLKWEHCLPVVVIADTLLPHDLDAIEDGKDVLLDGYLITDIDLTENVPVVHINPKE